MFEGISGRSDVSTTRRRIGLATALGLHAVAIGAALIYLQLTRKIPEQTFSDPVITFPNRPETNRGRGEKLKPGESTTKEVKKSRPPHARPLRARPADPASIPREPEQIAEPASPLDAPPSSEPAPGDGPLGAIDAGGNGPGDPAASACPQGAICDSSGDQILSLSASMKRPRPNCDPPAPLAPQAASQFGIEGRVVAQYVVHADGRADAVNILNSDAPPIFVESVRAWIEQCSFTPAELDDAPHAVRIVQAFHFKTR